MECGCLHGGVIEKTVTHAPSLLTLCSVPVLVLGDNPQGVQPRNATTNPAANNPARCLLSLPLPPPPPAYRNGLSGALSLEDGPVLVGGYGTQRAAIMRHVAHRIDLQRLGRLGAHRLREYIRLRDRQQLA